MTGETSLHLPGDLDTAVCGELDAWRAGAGALRVHLGSDVKAGLALLRRAIEV